jgi:hypothetical protein
MNALGQLSGHLNNTLFFPFIYGVFFWKNAQVAGKPSPEGSVRLDALHACVPVSRQGMKTHDPSIPTNLCLGFPPLPE